MTRLGFPINSNVYPTIGEVSKIFQVKMTGLCYLSTHINKRKFKQQADLYI